MPSTNAGATNAERLAQAARLLQSVSDTPRLDAEILLAAALGVSRAKLLASLSERADAPAFDTCIERRLNYEPLAYILGEWEFFSLPFNVRPPLLVPRPETEHLVEAILDYKAVWDATRRDATRQCGWCPPFKPFKILEIGAGTGCVSVAIAVNVPGAAIVATDLNPLAIDVARQNAERHGVLDRIAFRQGDLFGALESGDGPFDVVCSNPPYIEDAAWPDLSPVIRMHEDPRALLAGPDGLGVIRGIVNEAPDWLAPGGLLAFEIGMGQDTAVESMLRDGPYGDIRFRNDLACIRRIACAKHGRTQTNTD
jgi:release factor glutamine methyltransferase